LRVLAAGDGDLVHRAEIFLGRSRILSSDSASSE
jgi:hypothetical protein